MNRTSYIYLLFLIIFCYNCDTLPKNMGKNLKISKKNLILKEIEYLLKIFENKPKLVNHSNNVVPNIEPVEKNYPNLNIHAHEEINNLDKQLLQLYRYLTDDHTKKEFVNIFKDRVKYKIFFNTIESNENSVVDIIYSKIVYYFLILCKYNPQSRKFQNKSALEINNIFSQIANIRIVALIKIRTFLFQYHNKNCKVDFDKFINNYNDQIKNKGNLYDFIIKKEIKNINSELCKYSLGINTYLRFKNLADLLKNDNCLKLVSRKIELSDSFCQNIFYSKLIYFLLYISGYYDNYHSFVNKSPVEILDILTKNNGLKPDDFLFLKKNLNIYTSDADKFTLSDFFYDYYTVTRKQNINDLLITIDLEDEKDHNTIIDIKNNNDLECISIDLIYHILNLLDYQSIQNFSYTYKNGKFYYNQIFKKINNNFFNYHCIDYKRHPLKNLISYGFVSKLTTLKSTSFVKHLKKIIDQDKLKLDFKYYKNSIAQGYNYVQKHSHIQTQFIVALLTFDILKYLKKIITKINSKDKLPNKKLFKLLYFNPDYYNYANSINDLLYCFSIFCCFQTNKLNLNIGYNTIRVYLLQNSFLKKLQILKKIFHYNDQILLKIKKSFYTFPWDNLYSTLILNMMHNFFNTKAYVLSSFTDKNIQYSSACLDIHSNEFIYFLEYNFNNHNSLENNFEDLCLIYNVDYNLNIYKIYYNLHLIHSKFIEWENNLMSTIFSLTIY